MKIEKLKVNHVAEPLGFAMDQPTFSYVVTSSTGRWQKAARIRVASDETMETILYDSGMRDDISSLAFAPDVKLTPRTRYYWNVEAVADDGDHGISETAWFETGKMEDRWSGCWIRAPFEEHPILSKTFAIRKPVRAARLYLCGLGLYEAYLNGEKTDDEYLAPFFTSYNHQIQYQTCDVTSQLNEGENRISVMLGRGWYHGRFCFGKMTDRIYGNHMQLIAELHVTYEDGTCDVIGTDESWECAVSPVVESSIYDGEIYDARLEGGNSVFAVAAEAPEGKLCARLSVPVRKQEKFDSYTLLHTPAGDLVLDFGQVITGWTEFDADLPAGTSVTLQYGELLQNDCFYRENLRTAKAEHVYTSDGKTRHVRPHFTFYGFRYVKVEGMNEDQIREANFTAWAIYSDLDQTGTIETSNEKVNRLIANAVWSQKGNFLDVPTDCPQRDERMGWTGDAQVFASTASFNMDTAAFYRKYLRDMLLEQRDNGGSVPFVVPDVLQARLRSLGQTLTEITTAAGHGSCAWGDAATVIPWVLYQYYGDRKLLEETYENMRAWTDYIHEQDVTRCNSSHLWSCGFHFADWLALDNPDKDSRLGGTESTYVATAYYYWSASLTAKAASVLGKTEEAKTYSELASQIKAAFCAEYYTSTGKLAVPTQTAHVMALQFGLVPEQFRTRTISDLKERLDARQIHLDTGFVGTSMLCDVLSENGLGGYAYTLLLNEDFPSWLYEVNMGATTIWERWNSVLPDGSVSDTGMNSMNHYSYGAVLGWMYRTMAGVKLREGGWGWKKAVIAPVTDERFAFVTCGFDSASGRYESSWKRDGEKICYQVKVPFDAEAVFVVPEGQKLCQVNGCAVYERELVLDCGEYVIWAEMVK